MSPSTSLRIPFLVPTTHSSSCVDSSVKDIFFDSPIGTEIRFFNNQLFTMDESSDTDTEMDELSATIVNVVVADSEDNPIAPAPLIIATNSQIDESLDDDPTTNDIPLTVKADQFHPVRVEERVWYSRMHDEGCEKSKLPKKTYLQSTIPPIGPKDSPLFYYDLSSIAIDLLKKMWYEKEMGRGWAKLPKNKTDIKVKIIKGLLALRKRTDSGQYTLSQTKILEMLSNQ